MKVKKVKFLNSSSYSIKHIRLLSGLVFFLCLLSPAYNQDIEKEQEIVVPKHRYFEGHNTTKAMWMSAALPGLGQYYNQKYWKIPIVYAGFTTLAYFSIINKQEYVRYRDAYVLRQALDLNGETSDDPLVNNNSSSQLLSAREYYQGNLELNYILFGAFYILQIIDATVDAHFYDFDINENLSFGVDPIIYQDRNRIYAAPGIQLRFTFGNP